MKLHPFAGKLGSWTNEAGWRKCSTWDCYIRHCQYCHHWNLRAPPQCHPRKSGLIRRLLRDNDGLTSLFIKLWRSIWAATGVHKICLFPSSLEPAFVVAGKHARVQQNLVVGALKPPTNRSLGRYVVGNMAILAAHECSSQYAPSKCINNYLFWGK